MKNKSGTTASATSKTGCVQVGGLRLQLVEWRDSSTKVELEASRPSVRSEHGVNRQARRQGSAPSQSGSDGGDDPDGEEDGRGADAVNASVRLVAPTQLRLHPRAGIVPEMSKAEYAALVADIKRDGVVLEPLCAVGDVVLDGRHRLLAATELGLEAVPVRDVHLGVESELSFMLRTALHRRHLSDDQRAMMAAMAAREMRGGGR